MYALFAAALTDRVASAEPLIDGEDPDDGAGFVSSFSDVFGAVVDNLGDNGYQTGIAVLSAAVAVIVMLNIKVHRVVIVPVAIGAFWFGWLIWNTLTLQDNQLFPGDVSASKLWDVAFAGETGFLLVAIVASIAAVFLWRKSASLASRVFLLVGAVLGASFVYNLVESVRVA